MMQDIPEAILWDVKQTFRVICQVKLISRQKAALMIPLSLSLVLPSVCFSHHLHFTFVSVLRIKNFCIENGLVYLPVFTW